MGVFRIVPDGFDTLFFPYSRLYCDVERFRDGNEPMNRLGMGYLYTNDTQGGKLIDVTPSHRQTVDTVYTRHHRALDQAATGKITVFGKCLLIDLHSYSDLLVQRLFRIDPATCPDICLGTEAGYTPTWLIQAVQSFFMQKGFSIQVNFPYHGTMIPNAFFGKPGSGLYSIMLEINRRAYIGREDDMKHTIEELFNRINKADR